jgi:hypothetical protein
MLNLKRVFKNYEEAGSLNAMVNLFGFVGPHVFLTKSGEVGLVLEVGGVDYARLTVIKAQLSMFGSAERSP